ncbi:DNA translocase FtsK, partial [Candidatus Babeliales bacterium]|nr:DNA translocase FtsK [Candidatus Babeliales bacterium]
MARQKRKASRNDWERILLLFIWKTFCVVVKATSKMCVWIGIVLAWAFLRPAMYVLNFLMLEFVLLPLRVWQVVSWVWPKIIYLFDDVVMYRPQSVAAKGVKIAKQARRNMPAFRDTSADCGISLPPDPQIITQDRPSLSNDTVGIEDAENLGCLLEDKLSKFGVNGKITAVYTGPVITQFEYRPSDETKISKILSLEDDLTMAMTAMSVRILAPIPGKNAVGFEIAHKSPQSVYFDELLFSDEWVKSKAVLPLVLGSDGIGQPVVEDLVQMPHLLVAGATGSGKSVCMHSILS